MENTKNTIIGVAGTSYSFAGLPFDIWAAILTALYMLICLIDKLFPTFIPEVKYQIKKLFRRVF